VVVGVDMALKFDSAAIVVAGFLGDGRIGWWHKHFPPVNGRIDHIAILNFIRTDIAERWKVRAIAYDPKYFELPARILEMEDGFEMIEYKQSPERLVVADGLLYSLVRDRKLAIPNDPVLNQHATNAAWRLSDAGRYLSKAHSLKSGGQMDLIRAGSMATHELMAGLEEAEDFVWVIEP